MNYAENLQMVSIIFAMTLFIMSWDYVPPIYKKIKTLIRG